MRQSLSRLFRLEPHRQPGHEAGHESGHGAGPARPRYPGLAAVAERIERAPALDRPVRFLSDTVVRALPPGSRTDALHGVPFGQPAHPALVWLPLGCWSSGVLLDFFPSTERAVVTLLSTGLLSSLPSAATGLADWSALHRHQQRVGLVHAACQLGASALFGASVLVRVSGRHREGKVLSLGGLAVATAGSYLGGHLALRLGAGASHAEPVAHLAGLGWQDLCALESLPDGRPARRQLGYLSLLALRQGDSVSVLSDHCTHLGGPLHQGRITTERGARRPDSLASASGSQRGDGGGIVPPGDGCVTCPWHGSVFRLADGEVVHGPATARQPSFQSRVNDAGWVQVRVR
ncbi:MAG: Rieske 2Fe-2S domain-containing protein [Trebonia sp.]